MGAIIRLDERHAKAYVAEPQGTARGRVLVVHDAYGLLPHIRFLCDELAGTGIVALAPDLFDGTSARTDAQASQLLEQLAPSRAERVLGAALRAYVNLGQTEGPTAAVGFSIGAEFAFGLAARGGLELMISYYGLPSEEDREQLGIPLLAHWAQHDAWDDESAPQQFVAELSDRGVEVTSHVYLDTRHGFANADIDAFDLHAAEKAWNRSVEFLTTHIAAA